MNRDFSGAVLLLMLAAGGIAFDRPSALLLAIVTAALAFLAEEGRAVIGDFHPVIIGVAILSWLTTLAAFTILIL